MLTVNDIRVSPFWAVAFIGATIYVIRRLRQRSPPKTLPQPLTSTKQLQQEHSEASYHIIEPLADLQLENEEPIKIRPFKPKYHLTMSIENTMMSDLVVMDKTYIQRVDLRSRLIRERQGDVMAYNLIGEPAVLELYEWLVKAYLPARFPTVWALSSAGLTNKVTQQILPLHVADAEEALKLIGSNVDNDFLFLLPITEPGEDQGKYRLEAFITCFPSGFNTRSKLSLKLADIHTPVPEYATKLEKSMDRFFATLPVGKIVKRHNWTVTTNTELFTLGGNHFSEEETAARQKGKGEDVDLNQTMLRCERQTLHRLPKSKAVVFAFKTYQYPIKELRDEGSGEELAQSIDGLGLGNVPGMAVYKRQVIWGEKVKAFLRGDIELDGESSVQV